MQATACRLSGTAGPIPNLRAGRRDAAEAQVNEAIVSLAAAGAVFVVVTSGTPSTLTGEARKRWPAAFSRRPHLQPGSRIPLVDASLAHARAAARAALCGSIEQRV